MPLNEFEFEWSKVSNIQLQLEKLIRTNYFLNLSAKEAFRAYVRAYESHSLKRIFDVQALDLVAVGKSFGFERPPHIDIGVGVTSNKRQRVKDNDKKFQGANKRARTFRQVGNKAKKFS